MRAGRLLVASICALVLASQVTATGNEAEVSFGAAKSRFVDTSDVTVSLVNDSDRRVELFGGAIREAGSGDRMVRLRPESRFLTPGDSHEWTWLHDGDAGIFRATFETSVGTFEDTFEVGAFFSIGFRCNDTPEDCPAIDRFVIFARQEKPIRQLRADLTRAEDERRIVSGIVRGKAGYNPSWSFTMSPGSIVLGDVFVEVCDAHPKAVENHHRRWMGERWCPWSSYVIAEGR